MATRGQPIYAKYFAWNTSTGQLVAGDVANHTIQWNQDGTPAATTNAPTEPGGNGQGRGTYQVLLTVAEATCNDGQVLGYSRTSNVVLIGAPYSFDYPLGAGVGPIAITSDTGPSGTPVEDFLTYQNPQGVGIGGATVLIYLATDWPGNPANVQAQGATQTDGTWGPLFVNHGTYVAVFNKTGVGGPDTSASFTV